MMRGLIGHIESHFHNNGLCQCPCDDCTTSFKLCVCAECPCDGGTHETPQPTEPLPTHCPECKHELWNAWAETDTIVGGLCMECGITYYGVAS